MLKPLRQAINDVVVEYVTSKLRTGEPVDVAFMAREMSLPLIDMVMEQDEKAPRTAARSDHRELGQRVS